LVVSKIYITFAHVKENKMMKTYFEEEKFKALANPNGLSGYTSPDGTPMTNYEYYFNRIRKRD